MLKSIWDGMKNLIEETKEDEPEQEVVFEPFFEITKDEIPEKEEKSSPKQISFEEILGHNYGDLTFEKVSDKKPTIIHHLEELEGDQLEEDELEEESNLEDLATIEEPIVEIFEEKTEQKPMVQNDINTKVITFGLNDRIGFEKNLFGGSSEDMNRVISQISTFDTFEEAKDFIEDMVKPDYNNWDGKEDYALRFMEIVERKF
jgi:hypothetical protein